MKVLVVLLSILILSIIGWMLFYEQPEPYKTETFHAKVKINSINTAKYSNVIGIFEYNNRKYQISNGNDGYYYKKYNLHIGDTVEQDVTLKYYRDSVDVDNLYDDIIKVEVGSVLKLDKYEIDESRGNN